MKVPRYSRIKTWLISNKLTNQLFDTNRSSASRNNSFQTLLLPHFSSTRVSACT